MLRFEFDIQPVAKPRMTRADSWKQRPPVLRYRAFCDELRIQARNFFFEVPAEGLTLLFILPVPASMSSKRRAELAGKPHQKKPDIDNLLKAFLDALCLSDAHVWDVKVQKRWGPVGKIVAFIER